MPTKTNTLGLVRPITVVLGARISSALRCAVGATIVGFVAVLGAFCFPADAFAYDYITGTTTIGAFSINGGNLNGRMGGTLFNPPSTETWSDFTMLISSGSLQNEITPPVQVAIYVYESVLSGNLGTLIAQSATSTISTATTTPQEFEFTFASPVTTEVGTTYAIVARANKFESSSNYQLFTHQAYWNGVLNENYTITGSSTATSTYRFIQSAGQPTQFMFKTDSLSPSALETRIVDISPFGTTVASTTVDFSIDYFVNDTQFATSTNFEICISGDNLELMSQLNPSANSFYMCEYANSSGDNTFATSTILNVGLYQGYVNLLIDGELYESQPFRFVVQSTTLIDQWPVIAGNASTTGGFFQACETEAEGTIAGYIQTLSCWIIDGFNGVMSWLFMPSQTSTDRFRELTLRNKMPFEYGYQMGDIWDALYTSDNGQTLSISASTTIGTITFISADMVNDWEPIPSLIRTTLAAILWLMCAQFIWRRLQRVHDK